MDSDSLDPSHELRDALWCFGLFLNADILAWKRNTQGQRILQCMRRWTKESKKQTLTALQYGGLSVHLRQLGFRQRLSDRKEAGGHQHERPSNLRVCQRSRSLPRHLTFVLLLPSCLFFMSRSFWPSGDSSPADLDCLSFFFLILSSNGRDSW